MKNSMRFVVFLLVVIMLVSLTGCTQSGGQEPAGGDGGEAPADPPEEAPSVALVLPGPISDMGWNASGYEGLMIIESQYGAEVSYAENVSESDAEGVMRDYANAGFDIVFVHGAVFQDAMANAAPDCPDTMFVITNYYESDAPNIVAVAVADAEQGFLMGAFSALMTKSGTVGVIGGIEIPPITDAVKGFAVGAAYADPDVKVLSAMTGSVEDAGLAKEVALSMIDQGADFVSAIANQAGLGVLEATADKGMYSVGANVDQFDASPDSVVTSVTKEVSKAYDFIYSKYLEGDLNPEIYRIGAKEDLIYLTPYHDFEDFVPEEVKTRIQEITQDLIDGKVDPLGN